MQLLRFAPHKLACLLASVFSAGASSAVPLDAPAAAASAAALDAAFSAQVLPEPGTLVLVGAGLVVAWWWWRRAKRAQPPSDPAMKGRAERHS